MECLHFGQPPAERRRDDRLDDARVAGDPESRDSRGLRSHWSIRSKIHRRPTNRSELCAISLAKESGCNRSPSTSRAASTCIQRLKRIGIWNNDSVVAFDGVPRQSRGPRRHDRWGWSWITAADDAGDVAFFGGGEERERGFP